MNRGLVRSHRSQIVVDAARLHRSRERRQRGLTLVEGPHLLEAAILGGAEIQTAFTHVDDDRGASIARSIGLDPVVVDDRALSRLSGTETPRGPVTVVAIPADAKPASTHLLVAWGVSDPGNVGTMIRVAAGFGWDFAYTPGSADPWSPKVLRAGAGSQFSSRIAHVTGLDAIRSAGYSPLGSVVSGGEPPESLGPGRWALLIGEEASGLPADIVESSDRAVTISLPGGLESLNAGVAAGILVYVVSKQSGEAGEQV